MIKPEQLTIGLRVRSNREFSGVPAGTIGSITRTNNSWPDSDSVAVKWKRYPGDTLIDWFSFDDLEYLNVSDPATEKFDIEFQFLEYVRRGELNLETAPPIQVIETRRAFYGAVGQMLILLRDDVSELPDDEAVTVLQKMLAQVLEFWTRETNRQN
jgi:hypothetical protein